jgi:hypothetical protein
VWLAAGSGRRQLRAFRGGDHGAERRLIPNSAASFTVPPAKHPRGGRPATGITPMVGLRMPSEMREQVEKLAREDGVTLSKKILEMIAERLPKKRDTK